jgi:hypothetical protein
VPPQGVTLGRQRTLTVLSVHAAPLCRVSALPYRHRVIRWRAGVVRSRTGGWGGLRGVGTVDVEVDGEIDGAGSGELVGAIAYVEVTGVPEPGERVLLTTAQLDAGLGTGGWAFVAARPDAVGDTGAGAQAAATGHLVKDRYSPLQQALAGADEQGSPWHTALVDADDLAGMPVVVADLHSALPAVMAGIRTRRPDARVAYVMSDGGALPLAFSRTVSGLVAAGWLGATVTAGQAWGGDFEAVTVHSALLVARVAAAADLVVLTQGPGNLGTGTRFGFSGVASGEAVNATATLNGRPVGALRVSAADPRERHRGVSHHSLTAYSRVALARADIVVPVLGGEFGARVAAQAAPLAARHTLVEVDVDEAGLATAHASSPIPPSSMGRGPDEDLPCFLAAAAAGWHAAGLL